MQTHARAVIIGGGMLGAGLLYHLAEEGWTDSLLIEKGELTSGSTWHAAGQCPSFIADYNMAKVHHYGNTLYPELEKKTGQYVGWHGCGGIRFALTPEEMDFFKHVEGVSKMIGFRMQVIGPDEINKIFPHVDTTGVLAGAWTLDDGHVDPSGCCNALAKGARDMGANIVRHNRVLDINQMPSGEFEVITEQGTVTAEHVVNAAGCFARKVSRMLGADVPITNMKHQYVVTEPIKEFLESDVEMPVIRDPYPSSYYRQEQKSALIGIYETHEGLEAWDETDGAPAWDSDNELFDEDIDHILPYLERVLERMPIWAESGIKRVINGAIPHTPDANPLVGPAVGVKNFWMCCGSAIGIAQGAGLGKYLAQWMVQGDSEINMSGLDPRRYCGLTDESYVRAKSFEDYTHMYHLHLPGEERPAGRGARTSTLYEKLKAKGAQHTEAAGWERPKCFLEGGAIEEPSFHHNNTFTVTAEECRAVRERVGILDLSSFAKFDVTGAGARAFLSRIVANRIPKKDGGIVLAHLLGENGRMHGEVTISRLAEDHYYLLSGAAAQHRDLDHLALSVLDGEQVNIADITDDYGVLVLAGPKSREVLSAVTDEDLSNESFRWLTGHQIDIGGAAVRALRVNYVGELGWELHAPMADLPAIYDTLWAAGEAHGIADFGVYAVNSLRLEKAYKGWGVEMTNEITMIEADMERFINWDKGEFTGRQATQQRKQDGIETQLVYAELNTGDCDARGGEAVLSGDDVIGVTTSGGFGHVTGKSLFFAYVAPAFAAPGSNFEVEVLGDRRQATVLAEPVWDPTNERLRG
jgi:dimethylglycine dehydrogenase